MKKNLIAVTMMSAALAIGGSGVAASVPGTVLEVNAADKTEKEAEKAAKKAEKEAEKAAKQAEKEAEKAKKEAEKEENEEKQKEEKGNYGLVDGDTMPVATAEAKEIALNAIGATDATFYYEVCVANGDYTIHKFKFYTGTNYRDRHYYFVEVNANTGEILKISG